MDEIPRKPYEYGICKKDIVNNKNRTCLFYYDYYDNGPRIVLSLLVYKNVLRHLVKLFT